MRKTLYHQYMLNLQRQNLLGKYLLALLCTSTAERNWSLENKPGAEAGYDEEMFMGHAVHQRPKQEPGLGCRQSTGDSRWLSSILLSGNHWNNRKQNDVGLMLFTLFNHRVLPLLGTTDKNVNCIQSQNKDLQYQNRTSNFPQVIALS